MGIIDLLFPKRCVVCGKIGNYLCEEDKKKIKAGPAFCPVCEKPAIGGTTHPKCSKKRSLDGLICLFSYSTPIRELIHELKYRLVKDLQTELVGLIVQSPDWKNFDFSGFTLAPVPLAQSRANWRGFNQSETVGKALARKLKLEFSEDILEKIKDTKPQAKLLRKERLAQVRFAFSSTTSLNGQNFLLLDDVWTTGATMKAAASALKRKGAGKVWGVVIATSKKDWGR